MNVPTRHLKAFKVEDIILGDFGIEVVLTFAIIQAPSGDRYSDTLKSSGSDWFLVTSSRQQKQKDSSGNILTL